MIPLCFRFLFFFLLSFGFAHAEKTKKIRLDISIRFNQQGIEPNDSLYLKVNEKDSILLTSFKFYLSSIELLQNNDVVWKEENSYHLVNLINKQAPEFDLSLPEGLNYNSIRFLLGTDSATNVSGAMGGALDPVNGMYWTWQSGYINFKIEGKSNLCPAPKQEFIFHLGGYQFPFASAQNIQLELKQSQKIKLQFDLSKWLQSSGFQTNAHLMSPGARAKSLSELAATCFTVLP